MNYTQNSPKKYVPPPKQPRKNYMNDYMGSFQMSSESASWAVAAAVLFLVFVLLTWIFFYKILFGHGKHCKQIPWYGFGVFLFIIATIYVFIAIAFLVTASIQLAEEDKKKKY